MRAILLSRIKALGKKHSTREKIHSFSGDWVEKLLYGLSTLAFCAAPFLITEITVRQGVIFFLIILLFLLVFVLGLRVNKKKS